MEFLSNKPLLITDTILRDAHQSQAATRMTTEDMLPALEMLDSMATTLWSAGAAQPSTPVCVS